MNNRNYTLAVKLFEIQNQEEVLKWNAKFRTCNFFVIVTRNKYFASSRMFTRELVCFLELQDIQHRE